MPPPNGNNISNNGPMDGKGPNNKPAGLGLGSLALGTSNKPAGGGLGINLAAVKE